MMEDNIELPNSQYININLGLKYLNNNKKLYLKILNSFIVRYNHLNLPILDEDELKSTMHTIKGLSATLGMEKLSTLAKKIHDKKTNELLEEFTELLALIIGDLTNAQIKSLLIIDSNHKNIDTLINNFEADHDIIIATTISDALESISTEKIDLILLNTELTDLSLSTIIKEKNISLITFSEAIEVKNI